MVLAVIGAVCPIGAGSRMVVKGGSFSYHQGSGFCLQGSGLEMLLLIKGRHNGVVKTTNDSNIYKKKCLLLNLFVKNNDWYLKFFIIGTQISKLYSCNLAWFLFFRNQCFCFRKRSQQSGWCC